MSWPRMRLKFVTRFGYGDMLPADELQDGPVQVFGSNGPFSNFPRANTKSPAIVIGRKGSYDKVNWSADSCFASDTTFIVDQTTTQHDLRWLFWLLQTLRLDEGSYETAIPGLNREVAYQKEVLVPPASEQQVVAGFLDQETTKLDKLAEAKVQLLELLNEKRRAFILRAVTRGLNSRARMKASGHAWLGEVPAHWQVIKLKHFSKIGNGSTPKVDNPDYWADAESGFPWLNSSVVNQVTLTEPSRHVTQLALEECHLPVIEPPAVVVGITGQGKTRGMSTVVNFKTTINQHLAFVKPHAGQADCRFLSLMLGTAYSYLRSTSDGAGSTKGAITCEQLGNFAAPVPPLDEQKAIVAAIEKERARTAEFESALRQSITLLKERRAALITAAVTGKITVPEGAQSPTISVNA